MSHRFEVQFHNASSQNQRTALTLADPCGQEWFCRPCWTSRIDHAKAVKTWWNKNSGKDAYTPYNKSDDWGPRLWCIDQEGETGHWAASHTCFPQQQKFQSPPPVANALAAPARGGLRWPPAMRLRTLGHSACVVDTGEVRILADDQQRFRSR